MKKLFIAIMAVAAAVSCSTELTVDAPKGAAIAFDNAFVENATKAAADISAANLADFGVYGSIINAEGAKGMIFNNQTVAKSGDAFTYSPAQYWVAATTYNFVALAPQTAANWTYANEENDAYNGVISFNNAAAAGEQDLLFASHGRTTDDKLTAAPEKVAFTFNHMLSRVKFTFTNGFHQGSNVTLKVTDVTITNAHAEGTLAVANGVVAEDWTGSETTFARLFGNLDTEILAENGGKGATEHYYLLPTATATYDITFTVALYQAGVLVDTYNRNATISLDLEKGKSYNLQATLNQDNTSDEAGELYPIEFNATVNDWAAFGDATATVKEVVKVATAVELRNAIEAGNNVALTADINLDEVSSRANAYAGLTIDNDVVINGAGHKLTSSATRAINIVGGHTVTIMNAEVVAGNTSADYYRAINVEGANNNVTLENVTAYAYYYTVNLVSSVDNCVLNINNCNITGITAINVWGTNSVVTVNNSVLTCDKAPVSNVENYAVIMVNSDNSTVTVNGGEIVADAGNLGGAVDADGSAIVFNGTNGNCTIENHPYVISYGDTKYSMATWAEALETAQPGETIVLTQDVTTSTTLKVTKKITLDLNGKTIKVTNPGVDYTDGIKATTGAELTITGNGTVTADWGAVVAMKDAKVVIENGTFYGNESEVVFVQNEASVVINGGTYKQNEDPSITLNQLDKHRETSSILVNGGKFYQFNPADNTAEDAGTNFCAAGKTVEQDGDWYIVK